MNWSDAEPEFRFKPHPLQVGITDMDFIRLWVKKKEIEPSETCESRNTYLGHV